MSYFMSLSVWACRQRKGSHKTVKCFFSFPSTHFSFDRAFFARWAGRSGARRRLMERATWTNPMRNQAARMTRPSQIYGPQPFFSHSEAPLWSFWMYYSQSFTFCHLCLPLLPLPFLFHIPNSLFFLNACRLSLSFLFFSILVSSTALFLFSQTSWPAAHSDRVSTTLHVSRVAAPEVCPIACSAELFLNTFVSSLRSIHDLDSTTACFLQNHPHTLHRGCLLEVVLQNAYWMNTKTMYCAIHNHTIH